MAPTVFWPGLLGLLFLAAGLATWHRHSRAIPGPGAFGLVAYGPAFVAAALAAFAGEHFTAAAGIASIVPKWLPARLFIAYFVGVAHLAAATSYVSRRYVRWAAIGLAVMFGSFVLLMDIPGAIARPSPLGWMLAARQATFAMGGLALFAAESGDRSPDLSRVLAMIARIWTAIVLVCYGVQHLVHPELAPGVPSPVRTAAWVPVPALIAYATGLLLIGFGIAMLVRKYAGAGSAFAGLLMLLLTLILYVPQFFLAGNAGQQVEAINFIFDTLLFAGTLFVISATISGEDATVISSARTPAPPSRSRSVSPLTDAGVS